MPTGVMTSNLAEVYIRCIPVIENMSKMLSENVRLLNADSNVYDWYSASYKDLESKSGDEYLKKVTKPEIFEHLRGVESLSLLQASDVVREYSHLLSDDGIQPEDNVNPRAREWGLYLLGDLISHMRRILNHLQRYDPLRREWMHFHYPDDFDQHGELTSSICMRCSKLRLQ